MRQVTAEIRIQNQGGIQAFGQLLHPYASANERLELVSLRVVHPDGSLTEGPRAEQDLPAPVTAQFPLYSDLHFLHVTVPALKPGDRLEYTLRAEVHTPQAPGHFWLHHDFSVLVPALVEEVELDAPLGREIAFHSTGVDESTIREQDGRVIRRWERKSSRSEDGDAETPNIQASTFTSWDEVAAWYWELQRDRLRITPAMRRKVRDLTAGLDSESEKVRALYRHVAQEYRYLSLSFGLGRIQPHHASEVFESGYGDCKDKHTLLAALLAAIDVEARPVLISSTRDLVEAVPSPGQFDHLITAIPRRSPPANDAAGAGSDGWLWLDSTPAVAPFGYLLEQLRGRKALVVAGESRGEVATTPDRLPFPVENRVEFHGELSPLGRLTGTISQHLRGDAAVLLGAALLMSTEEDQREIVRRLATMQDLEGEVEDITHSDPLAVDSPLEVTFSLDEPNAWEIEGSSRRLTLPQSDIGLPQSLGRTAGEEPEPLDVGGPYRTVYRFEIRLPDGFSATPPIPLALERPFATYRSTYSVEGGVLRAERVVDLDVAEIAPADHSAWTAFRRAVDSDVDQFFNLRSSGDLDVAALDDVEELFEAGKAARTEDQHDEAIRLLERVTELDPAHAEGWFQLGRALAGKELWERAETAFRRAGELEPFHESAFEFLAWSLEKQDEDDEAIAAYRGQLEVNPLEHYSNDNLGRLLVESGRYEEALEPLRRADSIEPDDASTLTHLLAAYLATDRDTEAEQVKERLLASEPSARDLHDAADLVRDLEHPEVALELHEVAAERYSDLAWVWERLGYLRREQGDLPAAVEAMERAAEIDPEETDYIELLGLLYLQLGDYERAIGFLERAREHDPEDEALRRALIIAYTETKQPDKLRELFGMEPATAEAEPLRTDEIGFGARGAIEVTAAREELQQASAALGAGNVEQARKIFDRLLARSSHPALTSSVALMLASTRTDLERARRLAEQAEDEVLESLAESDLGMPREEALARLTLLQQTWLALSWVNFMELDLEQAALYLRPVVWLTPRADGATHLGQIQEQLGREQEAKVSYALALATGGYTAEANNRLDALVGYQAIQPFVRDVEARRLDALTIHFRPEERRGGDAEIRLLVDGTGQVLDLELTAGDAEILPGSEALADQRFELRLVPGKIERLLLDAELRCSPYAAECKLTVTPPQFTSGPG